MSQCLTYMHAKLTSRSLSLPYTFFLPNFTAFILQWIYLLHRSTLAEFNTSYPHKPPLNHAHLINQYQKCCPPSLPPNKLPNGIQPPMPKATTNHPAPAAPARVLSSPPATTHAKAIPAVLARSVPARRMAMEVSMLTNAQPTLAALLHLSKRSINLSVANRSMFLKVWRTIR
jgi:hypothetical protein